MKRLSPLPEGSSARRRGVTLMEILMSIMIMGIAVSSVGLLFPLSVLQTIKATHLTNATELRYNVESLFPLRPGILGSVPPTSATDTVNLPAYKALALGQERKAIVDPLGYRQYQADGLTGYVRKFGGGQTDALLRTHGGFGSFAWAEFFSTLPDSYDYITDDVVVNVTPDSPVAGESEIELDTQTVGDIDAGASRVVLFDGTGNRSVTLPVKTASGTVLTLKANPPTGMTIETARVETQDRRYTWMLTVRRNSDDQSHVTVVVFVNRTFATDDEKFYNARFVRNQTTVKLTLNATERENINLKKGGFIFDVQNAQWYRVIDLSDDKSILTLERPAQASSSSGKVAVMSSVVEVFPIGTHGPY
ncbi:MAG: hypothetical protein CMJ48_07450 [Planctomycetaceae bacterium]|nr:hypothetical protein [Planctomycetaceae bacterium]